MSLNHKGNTQPVIDQEEHDGSGAPSKRVTLTGWDANTVDKYKVGTDKYGNLKTARPDMNVKVTVVATTTYVGYAPPGTLQATEGWQCKKIDVSGGTTTITWADGDSAFNNIATDLTALSYS